MDHTDDYSQNWRVQGDDNRPLDKQTIEEFIITNGREQAIGYMRAIRDMIHELEYGLYDNRPDIGAGKRPVTRVKNNVEKLFLHKSNFLDFVNDKQLLGSDYKPE